MGTPSVLVVIPTLGERPEFLERALVSCTELGSLVTTTIAVVAPPAAKNARKMARQYGAVLVKDPGSGMADAVNAALVQRGTEDFSIWLGDDDELVAPGVLALVEALEQDASAVVAYGQCNYVNHKGTLIGTSKAGFLAKLFLPWGPNLIPHPGTVVRLDALARIGGFDSQLRYALDLDIFLKLQTVGRLVFRPVVSARFRWHPDSATVADRAASSREAMMVKNRHLPRWLRPFSWVWNYPVLWASGVAAGLVSARARRLTS